MHGTPCVVSLAAQMFATHSVIFLLLYILFVCFALLCSVVPHILHSRHSQRMHRIALWLSKKRGAQHLLLCINSTNQRDCFLDFFFLRPKREKQQIKIVSERGFMEARRSITKQCFSSSAWWDLLCYDNGYVHRTDHFISFGNQRSASAWLMMLTYPGFHPNGRQSIMGFGCVRLRYLSHTECFSTSLSHQYWNFLVFMSRAATVIHVHVGNFPIRIWYTIFFFTIWWWRLRGNRICPMRPSSMNLVVLCGSGEEFIHMWWMPSDWSSFVNIFDDDFLCVQLKHNKRKGNATTDVCYSGIIGNGLLFIYLSQSHYMQMQWKYVAISDPGGDGLTGFGWQLSRSYKIYSWIIVPVM